MLSIEEMHARLTDEQREALRVLQEAKAGETARQRAALMATKRAIVDAMQAGVPVKVIAETLRIGTARVYQIRQEVMALADKSKSA